MAEPPDLYADVYQVTTNPWAGTINFSLSSAIPTAPGQPAKHELVATIRMSLENMKLLAFFLHRQVRQHEENLGVNIQVPTTVLNQVRIGPEDWEAFWKRSGGDAR